MCIRDRPKKVKNSSGEVSIIGNKLVHLLTFGEISENEKAPEIKISY